MCPSAAAATVTAEIFKEQGEPRKDSDLRFQTPRVLLITAQALQSFASFSALSQTNFPSSPQTAVCSSHKQGSICRLPASSFSLVLPRARWDLQSRDRHRAWAVRGKRWERAYGIKGNKINQHYHRKKTTTKDNRCAGSERSARCCKYLEHGAEKWSNSLKYPCRNTGLK